MKRVGGKSVHKGIVVGKIVFIKKNERQITRKKAACPKDEVLRVQKASEEAKKQLEALYRKVDKKLQKGHAAVFEVHGMLLRDEEYLSEINEIILGEGINAEYAVATAGAKIAELFACMDDEYMKARAEDIRDVTGHLLGLLSSEKAAEIVLKEPSIIVAEELSPSALLHLDKKYILAFVSVRGSANSHTSIIAKGMGIPTLVGVPIDLEEVETGMEAVVDGAAGEIILNPTEEILAAAQEKMQSLQKENEAAIVPEDEKKSAVRICANIGGEDEADSALKMGADGIGLFRSEFLYMGQKEVPTEEEQMQVYNHVLAKMNGKKVVIRTMDLGSDKQAEYFHFPKEENPAMGMRGIRVSLTRPDIFKTQLRALFRAGVHGNLSILYPMIIATEEMVQIKRLVEEAKQELEAEGIPYKIPKQGIMIETPAAVMISDELAELADFFSIGTNDLTQYTLALDRQNENLDAFYPPHHKALLKMIQIVIAQAHKAGIKVSVCGELAADTALTKQFIKMGIDELSVAPFMVEEVRSFT